MAAYGPTYNVLWQIMLFVQLETTQQQQQKLLKNKRKTSVRPKRVI